QYTYLPRLVPAAASTVGVVRPACTIRSEARRSIWRGRAAVRALRTAPLPRGFAVFFAPDFDARAAGAVARARLDALADGLGILAAPAALPGRGRRVLVEQFADFLHQIFRQ